MIQEVKYYYPIDKKNNEVLRAVKAEYRGGMYHIPRDALELEPLPPKQGFAVVAVLDGDGKANETKYLEDHREKTIYNQSNCNESKTVSELGEIENGWTLVAPQTRFDEWNDGEWIVNLQNQYEAQVVLVSNTREALYKEQVDRLRNEATSIRRIDGDEEKAEEYEAQADAAYLKIRNDHPWPEKPASTTESE